MTAGADGTGPPAGRGWLPALLVALLTLPFHPGWLDAEQARRGLLLVLVGGLLLLRPVLRLRGAPGALPLLLLVAAGALHWLTTDRGADGGAVGVDRLLHLLALALVLGLARTSPVDWGRATAPALLAWSGYGLLQALGLDPLPDHGGPGSAVATFGNSNVASECTAIAAAAVAASWVRRAAPFRLGAAALVAATAYLVLNGSRSGMVALPLGVALLLVLRQHPWRRRAAVLGWLGGGIALAGLLLMVAPAPPVPAPPDDGLAAAPPSTLQVRVEIARGALTMAAEQPVSGFGPGQFQVHYPRFRSQREIELSSFGRLFRTEVRTAHNDYLEVLVEAGVPGLLLLLWFLAARARALRTRPERLAPWIVLTALMLVRSPLGNAPAIAIALLATATTPDAAAQPGPRSWHLRLLGVLLLGWGALPLLANTLFAPYLDDRRSAGQADPAPLERAAMLQPWEGRYHQLLAQERARLAGEPVAALAAAEGPLETALALRPHEPALHLLRADLLRGAGRLPEARVAVQEALRLDAGDPEARVLGSAIAFLQGDHTGAIAAVWDRPHPRLRRQLPEHFASLRRLLEQRGEVRAALRYAAEESFAETLLALDAASPSGLVDRRSRVQAMMQVFQAADLLDHDPRPWWLSTLHMLDLGDDQWGPTAARQAARTGAALPAWQCWLMGADRLRRLRSVPGWSALLPPAADDA